MLAPATSETLLRCLIALGVAALLVSAALSACAIAPARSGEPPVRAVARAYVLELAEGVSAADQACAAVSLAKHDVRIAERCAAAYGRARAALLGAELALDAAEVGQATCAAGPATVALEELATAAGDVPAAVRDALTMGAALARLAPCTTP